MHDWSSRSNLLIGMFLRDKTSGGASEPHRLNVATPFWLVDKAGNEKLDEVCR